MPLLTPLTADERQALIAAKNAPQTHLRERERIEALEANGLQVFFLPPYSPELNLIEPCWHDVKHYRLQQRVFTTEQDLLQGVERALSHYADEKAGRLAS